MSGVVAVVNFDGAPVDPQVLKKMAEQCAYRGPDGIHYWIQGNVGLAHLALNATPESLREHQPQLSADGKLCLTADVRVDNRPELIELLNKKGMPVTSEATDADLVIASYRVWGEHCPEQIIGDYAFIIWDANLQRLFAARDVYGVKSLHYSRHGDLLCVASEAQQIIQHPGIPRQLDEITVADFLVRNYNDEGRTMFVDVWAVRRANSLAAEAAGQRSWRYWDIDPDKRITYSSDEEYAAHFMEIFERSVSDRLRTCGKTLGITMSGGMDSTSVAASAQRIINSQPGQPPLLACSYAFDTLKECDETFYSKAMRDELGIELIYIPAENFWYFDDDIAFTPSLETPFMAGESITRHILGIFSEREARVWFTGHGGDNLLVGSPMIYADRINTGDLGAITEIARLLNNNKISFLTRLRVFRDWIIRPLAPEITRKAVKIFRKPSLPDWLAPEFVHRMRFADRLTTSRIPQIFSERARQANYASSVYIDPIQFTINWAERLGAQYHLEPRHPFLDRRLVEYLMGIPPGLLYHSGIPKYMLRTAITGILPEIICKRADKTEFSPYMRLGLQNKESNKIKIMLNSPLQGHLNWIRLYKLRDIYQRYLVHGNTKEGIIIKQFIFLKLWINQFYYNGQK